MLEKSSTLLKNVSLWAGNTDQIEYPRDVLVEDGKIVSVGENLKGTSVEVIEGKGNLLLPGFQQMHVHACQTLFRGLAEDLPLLPWLQKFIWPLEAAHTPESLRLSAEITALELLRGGTTGVFSFETVRHAEVVGEVYDRMGLRAVFAPCLMDESGGFSALAVDTREALDAVIGLHEKYRAHERVGVGLAPRFALACVEESLRQVMAVARENGLTVQIHANEQLAEIELVRQRTGRGNIQFLLDCEFRGSGVSFVHGVHLSHRERAQLIDHQLGLVHCPSANAKLGSGIAPIHELLNGGLSVSLGADGAPCNNRLDMFAEMRLAAFLQKTVHGPEVMPVEQILRMATQGGRNYLPGGSRTGVIAPGKYADLVLVQQSGWHCQPSRRALTNLVYSCQPEDVLMTMVQGRVLYREGIYPGVEVEAIRRKAAEEQAKLVRRAGL